MASKDLFGRELPPDEKFRLKNGSYITEATLKKADEETQLEAMRVWFFSNFQDPVEETPYDGREGGYQFIRGPYNARDQLDFRFEGIVPEEVRAALMRELDDQAIEWEGRADDDEFDEYLIASIPPPSEHIERFHENIRNIRNLVATPVATNEEQFFLRLLYASVITVLETYLSGIFVSSITKNPAALRRFVETLPKFQKQSITLSNIFKQSDSLEREVQKELLGKVLWHRLHSVREMFKDTFEVTFPEPKDLDELFRAIEVRHDLVHRSGKDVSSIEHKITPEGIATVIEDSRLLVRWIDLQNDKFNADDEQTEI